MFVLCNPISQVNFQPAIYFAFSNRDPTILHFFVIYRRGLFNNELIQILAFFYSNKTRSIPRLNFSKSGSAVFGKIYKTKLVFMSKNSETVSLRIRNNNYEPIVTILVTVKKNVTLCNASGNY